MRLLILTQYFPPEIGAPQNRLFELGIRLMKAGVEVTVLTAMPNYPEMVIKQNYKGKFYFFEKIQGMAVHRAAIFATTDRSIFKRLLNYFSFVLSSFLVGVSKLGNFDYIFCESPPLFLGITGYLLARAKGARLIFNVSDLWPESADKLGLVTNKMLLKAATWLEEALYRKAYLITGQTKGIVSNIKERFPSKRVYWLPNGVDLAYYDPTLYTTDWRRKLGFVSEDIVLLYAGIIGYAQGLDVILRAAEMLRSKSGVKFILLGDGPEKERLQKLASDLKLGNVIFLDPVTKAEMPHALAASTATIIPLKRLELFKGAIPSKIFESLAMEKPILLGVEGEAKDLFVEEGKCGLFFTPESAEELVRSIEYLASNSGAFLQLGKNARKYVDAKFNRNQIADDFYRVLEKRVA